MRVLRCRFQSPPQCHQRRPPVRVRVRVRLMQAGRVRVPLQAEQAGRVRRGPPAPLPVQSGEVRRGSMLPALPWSGAVLRSWSGSWSGAAISESNRDFSAPYTGPKISSDFPGEVFYAHGLSLVSWYINAPPIVPPRLVKINWKFWRLPRRKCSGFRRFRQKTPRIFCAKIFPQSPYRGDVGNGFRGVDGAKIRRYYARQAQATRPRPSEPPPPRRRPERGGEREHA